MPHKRQTKRRHTKPKTKITRKRRLRSYGGPRATRLRRAYGGEKMPHMMTSQSMITNRLNYLTAKRKKDDANIEILKNNLDVLDKNYNIQNKNIDNNNNITDNDDNINTLKKSIETAELEIQKKQKVIKDLKEFLNKNEITANTLKHQNPQHISEIDNKLKLLRDKINTDVSAIETDITRYTGNMNDGIDIVEKYDTQTKYKNDAAKQSMVTEIKNKYDSDTQSTSNSYNKLIFEKEIDVAELANLEEQNKVLSQTPKPEDLASVPPQVQYEGVCYAHAFARSLLRTLRVLGLVTHTDNDNFYYALFTFGLINDDNGGDEKACFIKFIELITTINQDEFFNISSTNITKIFGENTKKNAEILKNIPETNRNVFLEGFKKKEFIDKFTELYNNKQIYLMHQKYTVDANTPTPISSEIKNALEHHLQPTIGAYDHSMVLRGWGGTDNDIYTVYIKNTWQSTPLIVVSDLNLLTEEIHKFFYRNNDNKTKFEESEENKRVVFSCLMIEDTYFDSLKSSDTYYPSYKCENTDNNKCAVASNGDHINTYYYQGNNKWNIVT